MTEGNLTATITKEKRRRGGDKKMADRFEELLQKADFTKESNLRERLEKELFSKNTVDFMRDRKLSEEDLETLAAAGNINEVRLKKEDD